MAKSYALNHGNKHLLVEGLRNIKEEKLRSLIGSKESLDLLVRTPPCQSFSKKRSCSNFDIRNNLILEVSRIVDILHPTFVLFENIINYIIFHMFLKYLANIDRFGYKKEINRPSYHTLFKSAPP
ncbi:DNA cytosine methyltransferase [Paenibacillus agri]|uniref:DNA cytosine methyltransferase n=1 Tax=Paenibacillus agri TaxID=2744309 RepID=A0A850EJI6_9BACL|nr:DNA cytosine methyltransferase [Paenibacillus agri]